MAETEPRIVVLERGELRVALRPRVEHEGPMRFDDVQRFFLFLRPDGTDEERWRRIVIGRKRMPGDGDKEWAYVERIAGSVEELTIDLGPETYTTKTRGTRHQPGFRTIAHGAYAIVSHDDHAHLVYALPDLDVEDEDDEDARASLRRGLRLEREGSFVSAVFNPEKPWRRRARGPSVPTDDDGPFSEPPLYDDELMQKFEGVRRKARRYAPLEPAFLDHEGCEIVLVCAPGDGMSLASLDPMIEEPLKDDPRREDPPVEEPKKQPPAKDPSVKKAPVEEPPKREPETKDPPPKEEPGNTPARVA